MTDFTQIRLERDGPLATIVLDRPSRMNAWTRVMMAELIAALDETDADDGVRAVIVTGEGERAFCAGADLEPEGRDSPFASDGAVTDLSDEAVRDGGGRFVLRAFRSTKPLIAAVNGAAVGVGATMQLPMDFRLAADGARYGFVFARRGIVPEACSSWFLPRLVGQQRALEWCMTGRVFDAQEALDAGLVRSLHRPDELMDAARELALEIAQNTSATSIAMTRAMLWRNPAFDHPMLAHRVDSRAIFSLSRSRDAKEGVASFLEKRAPRFADRVSADMPAFYPWWEEPDWQ